MTLTVQFYTLLAMIGMGSIFGATLDTYQRFLKRGHRNRWIVFINDILFWMIQGLIIFYVLFLVNHGELRFYLIVGTSMWFFSLSGFDEASLFGIIGDADPFLCISNKVYYKVIPDSHLSTSPRNHLIHACYYSCLSAGYF